MEPVAGGNGRGTFRENYLHGRAVINMHAPVYKQGYVGELSEKSLPELEDLLQRQMKILSNRKLLASLPDKGEKVIKFAKTLKDAIASKEDNNRMMDMNEVEISTEKQEMITDNSSDKGNTDHVADLRIIERGFEQLTVHEGPFYQVVKKAEERKTQKSRFAINRAKTRNDNKHSEKPDERQHDLTSASVSDPSHGPTSLLSVNECCSLYAEQQNRIQEIQTERTADRILARMNASRLAAHPEGILRLKDGKQEKENDGFLDAVD